MYSTKQMKLMTRKTMLNQDCVRGQRIMFSLCPPLVEAVAVVTLRKSQVEQPRRVHAKVVAKPG